MADAQPPRSALDPCFTANAVREINQRAEQRVSRRTSLHHCNLCGRGFTRATGLSRHADEVHQSRALFECTQCGRGFTRNDHLLRHLRTHSRADASNETNEAIIPVSQRLARASETVPGSAYLSHQAFQRVLLKFRTVLNLEFPDKPCSYCGILLWPRSRR